MLWNAPLLQQDMPQSDWPRHKQAMIELKRLFGIMNIEDQPTHIFPSKESNAVQLGFFTHYIHSLSNQPNFSKNVLVLRAKLNNHSFF